MKEICKIIDKYPEYSISTTGIVIRNKWTVVRRGKLCERGGRPLKLDMDKKGYLRAHLYDFDGVKTKKAFLVHRLVASAFIPNTENKPHVNHKNGGKSDNRVENLEWCTRVENQQHAVNNGYYRNPKGDCHRLSKLTNDKVIKIRELYASKTMSQYILAEEYMVSQSTVNRIVKRISWSHI